MVAIPPRPEQEIIDRIYAGYEREAQSPDLYLGRLGSSFIGEDCVRKIWLEWRGFARENFEGRMLRLFGTGHWQEARVVQDLRTAGFSVWDKNESGKQFEFSDPTGHFVTKMDGVIKGVPSCEKTPHALEIKTHNKSSFAELKKHGVQKSKPLHYAQTQITMALAELRRTLYVAICKDDEQIHVERIRENPAAQGALLQKITRLTEATLRPAGISDDATSYACKYCAMKAVCTKEQPPLRHCRTCQMCSPGAEGKWVCALNSDTLSLDRQRLGCEHWSPL